MGWVGAINVKTQNRKFTYTSDTNDLSLYNFGFNIPINSIINGIQVRVKAKSTSSQSLSMRLQNVTDAANVTLVVPTVLSNVVFGSSISFPGVAGATVTDINNTNFGVVLTRPSTGGKIYVDVVEVTVFYSTTGTSLTVIKNLENQSLVDGGGILTRLVSSGLNLYGVTNLGGDNNYGYLFTLSYNGSGFKILHHFTNAQSAFNPPALTIGSDGMIYGSNGNVLYKINTSGTGYEEASFEVEERFSVTYVEMTDSSNTRLYLTTSKKIYAVTTDFVTSDLVFDIDDPLYAIAGINGNSLGFWEDVTAVDQGDDTVYIYFPTYGYPTAAKFVLFTILFSSGSIINSNIITSSLAGLGQIRSPLILSDDLLNVYGTSATTIFTADSIDGGNLTILHSFDNDTEGSLSYGRLLFSGNSLFGVCLQGGANNCGTLWKILTDGTGFQVLHHFSESTGKQPTAGLCYLINNLFGGTSSGGLLSGGTLFIKNAF